MSTKNTIWESLPQIAKGVAEGDTSARELVRRSLDLAREKEDFNALIDIDQDYALELAGKIDAEVKKGIGLDRKLLGVPFIIKDNYMLRGQEMTAASNILKGYKSLYSATIVQRILDQGAIPVGRANLDAFAHGASTENSDFGVTKNPHDKSRVAGGSSGGSAAAVALGIAPFALGSDTGGSIRLPASFCGVVGYKPSYGLNSRYGVVAMASSTDCMGPLTSSCADAEYITGVTSGIDPMDSTTYASDFQPGAVDIKGLKVGIPKQFFGDALSEQAKLSIKSSMDKLAAKGAEIIEVDLPSMELSVPVYYIVMPAEVSSNLARYDGMRYGATDEQAQSLEQVYSLTRGNKFNSENKRRIILGSYVLSSGFMDAYYTKALKVRTLMVNEMKEVFSKVDCLIGPTSVGAAFKIGENASDPLAMYLEDVMTTGYSLTGVPAISIPSAPTTDGMPVGLQIAAEHGDDSRLLAIAKSVEEVIQ